MRNRALFLLKATLSSLIKQNSQEKSLILSHFPEYNR